MERIIAHIDMDAYFASVEQQRNPSLRSKPVLVCGRPGARTVVAAASYEAKRFGVRSGMSVGEALSLCPDAVRVTGDHIRYGEISRRIFSLLSSLFTGELEVCSIDEGCLDASIIVELYGGKEALGREIKRAIRAETGLPCTIGIAPNKLLAKIAADLGKPDGLKIIEPDRVRSFMETLPVGKVPGIGPRLTALLDDWGITTCGHIRSAGESFFTARFGVRGAFIYQAGCGVDSDPVAAVPPEPKSIGHSHTLPFDTYDREFIRTALFRLAEQVAERMREGAYRGRTVTVCVRLEDFETFTRQKKYAEVPADGKLIFQLGWEIFSALNLKQRVRLVGISVGGISPVKEQCLFPYEEKREYLFGAVDSINVRFGEGTVVPATFLMEKKLECRGKRPEKFDRKGRGQ